MKPSREPSPEHQTKPCRVGSAKLQIQPPPKGRYRHFKGQEYQLVDVARHSETEEWMVIYKPLYGEEALWIRPLTLFLDWVERDGKYQPRFQKIAD